MADKDTALALLQGPIAIAGLVLVFSGFLTSKAADRAGSRSGDKFVLLARLGLVPVLAALFCSGMGIRVLRQDAWGYSWSASWLIISFEIVLALTAVYAIIAAFFSTPGLGPKANRSST